MSNTNIHFVLDRSGSMWETLNDTIGGFNAFIEAQKKDGNGECNMSLHQFDHEYETIYTNKPISEVDLLDNKTFVPRGQTALVDAIGRTISNASSSTDEVKNIVVILTDGEENASKEYKYDTISKMIQKKETEGWEFVFLGANQDAIKTAACLGIKQNSAMTYNQTPQNVRACFSGLSSAISRARSGEDKDIKFTQTERSTSQQ
jgi:uncharacterized protein YegL